MSESEEGMPIHNHHDCQMHCKGCEQERKERIKEMQRKEDEKPQFKMSDPNFSEIFADLDTSSPGDYGGGLIIIPIVVIFRFIWIMTTMICPFALDRYIQFGNWLHRVIDPWMPKNPEDTFTFINMMFFISFVIMCLYTYFIG